MPVGLVENVLMHIARSSATLHCCNAVSLTAACEKAGEEENPLRVKRITML